MDNLRLVLVFSLAVVLLLIYQAWLADYGAISSPGMAGDRPAVQSAAGDPRADLPQGVPQIAAAGPSVAPTPGVQAQGAPSLEPIRVETDVLRIEISPRGGTLASAWLLDYPVTPERPEDKVRLFKPDTPNLFLAQSGLIGADPEICRPTRPSSSPRRLATPSSLARTPWRSF